MVEIPSTYQASILFCEPTFLPRHTHLQRTHKGHGPKFPLATSRSHQGPKVSRKDRHRTTYKSRECRRLLQTL